MRIVRASKDVILKPQKGDRWIDVLRAVEEAGEQVRHDYVLQVTVDGMWAFVPPKEADAS